METKKNAIGFNYKGRNLATNKQEDNTELTKVGNAPQLAISKAHLELKQKIQGIANIILGPDFKEKSEAEQTSYLFTLISSVALDSELTTKNAILGIV